MKRIVIILLSLVLVIPMTAQSKDQVVKAVQKAEALSQNAKKATKAATWIKLGEAYMNAYNQPINGLRLGAPQVETKLILRDQKVLKSEVKTINGKKFTVDTYNNKALYYSEAGILSAIQITKPVMDVDLLSKAKKALDKAIEVDKDGKKSDDIIKAMTTLKGYYVDYEAMGAYAIGDVKTACKYFEASLPLSDNPVVKKIDSTMVYYTAVTAQIAGDKDKAIKYYNQCIDLGYYQKGDAFSSLAELYRKDGNTDRAKSLLSEGFSKFPKSQSILVSLINIYLETNDDPSKILTLIHTAQANEPNNASLHYAEGNVYKNLGDLDNAFKCYEKSYAIDSTYVFGVYTIGTTYFDKAIDVQGKMDKLDINDVEGYNKLNKEFEDDLKNAIDPFERAFNAAADKDFKISIADGLKQIYFRFRTESDDYMKAYKKYDTFLKENQAAKGTTNE